MFGPPSMNEGGNTRALIRDPETGLVKGPEQVKQFRGREAFAEKIDLRDSRITRQQLRKDVIEMLVVLDNEFERDHGEKLWDRSQRDDILGSGLAFNGSSSHLFAPAETLSDEEFMNYKPSIGDIDLTVPSEKMIDLFNTLNRREDDQLTQRIAYIGHNKKSPGAHQINALFAYTWDSEVPAGTGDTFFQIDFEGSEYESGRPTQWAKFSYSSSWRDIRSGIKGLAHKVLLFSLAAVRSPPPMNAVLATPSATAEKPKISMTGDPGFKPPSADEIEKMVQQKQDEILNSQKKKNPAKARDDAEELVRKQIEKSSKIPVSLRPIKSLDLVTGHGSRYKRLDWTFDGNEVYKYLTRAERTDAIRDVKMIFENLFGTNPPMTATDMENFGSFVGVLELMKERLSPQEIVNAYEEMVDRFFGLRAQQLSASDQKEDEDVKDKTLEMFRQLLPESESSTIDLDGLKRSFYSRYKVRGQEGFTEDDDLPRADESIQRAVGLITSKKRFGTTDVN